MSDHMSMLDEIRFWAQVIGDARRTIVCSPENESRIKGWIDARGMTGILTVKVNPYVGDDVIFVIDEQGLDAELRKPLRLR